MDIDLVGQIWYYVKRSTVKLSELDGLFSLPSIFNLPSFAFKFGTVYVLLIVAIIQALSLIAILAPNSLSVIPAGPAPSTLRVPVTALDMIPVTKSVVPDVDPDYCQEVHGGPGNCVNYVFYTSASTELTTVVRNVLNNGFILPWSAPEECGLACNYTVSYQGPSLQCTDIPASSIALVGIPDHPEPQHAVRDARGWLQVGAVYNATTNSGIVTLLDDQSPTYFPRYDNTLPNSTLLVVYVLETFVGENLTASEPAGASCTFVNASYKTFVSYQNETQTVLASVEEFGEPYQSLLRTNVSNEEFSSDRDLLAAYSVLGIMDALQRFLTGSVVYASESGLVPYSTGVLSSTLFTTQKESTVNLSTHDGSSRMTTTTHFSLARGLPLSQVLQDLCANVTASLMSDTASLGSYTTVSGTVLPKQTVYYYQSSRLWLVYGVAILVALVADAFGLACMRMNGGAMWRTFSAIAASTRGRDFDELLGGPDEPPRPTAKLTKLRYRGDMVTHGERSGFVVTEDGPQQDEIEMAETIAGREA